VHDRDGVSVASCRAAADVDETLVVSANARRQLDGSVAVDGELDQLIVQEVAYVGSELGIPFTACGSRVGEGRVQAFARIACSTISNNVL
jgi:hypothetical protein